MTLVRNKKSTISEKESFIVRSNDTINVSSDSNNSSIITGLTFDYNTSGWQLEPALGGIRNVSGRTISVLIGVVSVHLVSGGAVEREVYTFLERSADDGATWDKGEQSGRKQAQRGTSDQYSTKDSEVFSVLDGEIIRKKYFADAADETIEQVSFLADGDTVIGPSFRWRLAEV